VITTEIIQAKVSEHNWF